METMREKAAQMLREYVILKFTANHATYWIDGKFIHKKV